MLPATGETVSLDALLEGVGGAGMNAQTLRGPLETLLLENDTTPLLAWMRERAVSYAKKDHEVRAAIKEAVALSDLLTAYFPGEPNLEVELAAAAAEGYISGKAGPADGEVDERLWDRVAELTALHRVNSAANSSLKLADMLNETAQAVVAVTRADMCSIFLYEPEWDQLVLTATSGQDGHAVGKVRLQLGEGITGSAALLGKPLAVRDAWSDPRFKYVAALQEEKAVSMLSVPVVLFTIEKLVGVITIHTFVARDFSDNEIKFLETVAGEIAIAIENARLYEQTDSRLRQKVAELSTLQGVSAHIAATLNLEEVLALVAHQAAHLVHSDAASIYEMHEDAGIMEQVAQYNLEKPAHNIHEGKSEPRVTLDIEQSAIAQAVIRGVPVALPAGADAHLGVSAASEGYSFMFCVPLVAPRGIMGAICLYNRSERTFSDEQVALLDAFAREAAIAIENSRLYDAALRGLQVKSAMLQEMNHRVRNNLQTVAGLLSMQLRRMPQDADGATAVRESIARVESIAAVHDLMMSDTGDVESTSLYEIARKVAEAAASTLSKPGFDLTLNIEPEDASDIRVRSHEATLLALLLNELISNAILHGFSGLDRGTISIRALMNPKGAGVEQAQQSPDGRPPAISIEVRDDGVGLPEGFDPVKNGNLGLNIVRTVVVSDLRGAFKIESGAEGRGTFASFYFTPARP